MTKWQRTKRRTKIYKHYTES